MKARRKNLKLEQRGEGLSVRDPPETVAFRASQSERAACDVEWKERGFRNRSQALNAVLRGRCGFPDVGQGELANFCATWRQAKDVSDDVRTLAKAVVLAAYIDSERYKVVTNTKSVSAVKNSIPNPSVIASCLDQGGGAQG